MKRFSVGDTFRLRGRKSYGLRGWKGKPAHPPLTDIPVAAYVIAPVLDLIAFLGRNETWGTNFHHAAGYVFAAGAIVGVVTAFTGLLDWFDTEKGTQIRRLANAHALAMVTVTTLVLTNLGIRFFALSNADTPAGLLALSLVIGAIVFVGAAIGGSMVYDYGFNVANAKDHPVYHADSGGDEQVRRTG